MKGIFKFTSSLHYRTAEGGIVLVNYFQ